MKILLSPINGMEQIKSLDSALHKLQYCIQICSNIFSKSVFTCTVDYVAHPTSSTQTVATVPATILLHINTCNQELQGLVKTFYM